MWFVVALGLLCAPRAAAQAPVFFVDDETTVGSIDFRFPGTQTFDATQLKLQIATAEPGFIDLVQRLLPVGQDRVFSFSPLTLQKDVARLRAFYRHNGFLSPEISYADSRLDTASNTLDLVFTIEEGPPVCIASVAFRGVDGTPFPGPGVRIDSAAFREALTVRTGVRYSKPGLLQARGEALDVLRNAGYAFAEVADTAIVDSTALAAAVTFTVDPGPLAYFGDITVEGNETVSERTILRELPFEEGDRFREEDVVDGQRELFALDLFRTALVELPAQPRDSTVRVRVRVREARPQLITYEAGYGREYGVTLQGEWEHRNFLGAARTLTTSLVANTGALAAEYDNRPTRRFFGLSVSLRQPYLGSTKLSGSVAPFIQYERDPQLARSDKPLGINQRKFGLNTTLLYEIYEFRTVSLQHAFSRVTQFGTSFDAGDGLPRQSYNESVLTLSATFGRADDYVNPTHGFLIRPSVDYAGPALGSDLSYGRAGVQVTGYLPLADRVAVAGRLLVGRLWPIGNPVDEIIDPGLNPVLEDRFDPILFYLGGGSDLRGWNEQLAGAKVVRLEEVDGDTLFSYEPLGGLAKQVANVEVRLPFPGMGPSWALAVFAGAGRLSRGDFGLDEIRVGTGLGLRYDTPVGFIRLDAAFKVNPSPEDLREPEAFYRYGEAAEANFWRRITIHFSIGQAF